MGLSFGSVGAGAVAIFEWSLTGASRVSGFAPTNKFGLISITMALMCVSGFIWTHGFSDSGKRKFLISSFLLAASFCGLCAAILSGSRGAWLALIPATLVYLLVMSRLLRPKTVFYLVGALAAAAILLSQTFLASGIENRLGDSHHEFEAYINGKFIGGSVGLRLEMWKGATLLFIERPYFGWGELGYASMMQDLETNNVIQEGTASFSHAHNDWFNVLAKKGLSGALILLAVYVAPLFLFVQTAVHIMKSHALDTSRLALAVSGIILVLSFMSGGIAQITFNRNIGVMVYGFMVAVLVGLLTQRRLSK
jgi:O-antigen ligase